MAHNTNTPPAPPHFNPYPAWSHLPPVPAPAPAPAQHPVNPYTPLQPASAPQPAHPLPLQNMPLPPELQNLNLTPQQMAAMFTFFQAQSSVLPLPPPPPSFTAASTQQSTYLMPSFPPPPADAQALQEHGKTPAYPNDPRPNIRSPLASVDESMPVDREDGELSDAGQMPVQSYPSPGPKKRKLNASPHNPRLVSQRSSRYDETQSNGHGHPRPTSTSQPVRDIAEQEVIKTGGATSDFSLERNMVLAFVAAMHDEGFSFGDLAREGLNPSLLRAVYEELRIPIKSDGSVPQVESVADGAVLPGISNVASNGSSKSNPVQALASKNESAKSPVASVPNGVVPAPVDRQSYLARLQAAKVRKGTTSAPHSSIPPPKPIPGPAPAASAPAPAPAPASNITATPTLTPVSQPLGQSEGAIKSIAQTVASSKPQGTQKTSDAATELVRKKMEALKSLKRRMAPQPPVASPSPASSVPPTVSQPSLSSTVVQQGAGDVLRSQDDMTATGIPVARTPAPAPGLSIGGIPGLFMATTTPEPLANISSNQIHPKAPLSLPQPELSETKARTKPPEQSLSLSRSTPTNKRRPIAADLNEASVQTDVPKYKRPFGQSRQNSSDDAMIIEVSDDEDASGIDMPTIKTNISSSRQKSIRDLPPLRDFPHRTVVSKPATLPGTPTPLGTPSTSTDVEELKRKEQEINALQLRIQEFERRKTALRAKAQMSESRQQSPSITQRSMPLLQPSQAIQASHSPLPGLSATQLPGLQPQLQASPDRHSKMKADISASDAALERRRTQMMELQRQMAELQKQCEEEELNKQKLREQLEKSDIDTQGMTHLEMQAKKEEIDRGYLSAEAEKSVDLVGERSGPSQEAHVAETKNLTPTPGVDGAEDLVTSAQGHDVHRHASQTNDNNTSVSEDQVSDSALGPLLGDANDDEGSSMSESTDSGEDDVDDAPNGVSEALPDPSNHPLSAEASSSGSDVEMDTSESSSDESDDDNQESGADTAVISTITSGMEPRLDSRGPLEHDSGVAESPVDDGELEGTDMDLDSSDSDDESDYEPTAAVVPTMPLAPPAQHLHDNTTSESFADDLAPELQDDIQHEVTADAPQSTSIVTGPRYISYESPLRMFKKYRFHPDYLQNVAGGYHSLTYSHQILPSVPLCRFEFYGGDCRDQSCDSQHWRDLALSDDQLLIQLGTNQANPGKTKEDIARYNAGLKRIIQELRQEDTSDTEVVGARIAQYRRQFIGDPTVVVTQ